MGSFLSRMAPPSGALARNLLLAASLLLLLAGGGAGYWLGADHARDEAAEQAKEVAKRRVFRLAATTARLDALPEMLGLMPEVQAVLQRPGDARNQRQAQQLVSRVAERFAVGEAFIVNRDGRVVAESGAGPAGSRLGSTRADRFYVREALAGARTQAVASDRERKEMGLYLAAPVYDENPDSGELVGAAVLRLGLDALSAQFAEREREEGVASLLMDPRGIVFVASRPEWLLHSVPDVVAGGDGDPPVQYGRAVFAPLALGPVSLLTGGERLVRIDGADYVAHRTDVPQTDWVLELYAPVIQHSDVLWRFTLLGTLSAVAAVLVLWIWALNNAYRKRLLESAVRDPLTGLYTRLFMREVVPVMLARRARDPHSRLSLVLFDIDHFKQVNDRHGHLAGDRVLAAVGQVVHQGLRSSELAVRYGGEELAVLLPGVDASAAVALAERLREAVAALAVEVGEESPLVVTVSAGVAEHRAGEDLEGLIARADEQLYRAKRSGRNRVCRDGESGLGLPPAQTMAADV